MNIGLVSDVHASPLSLQAALDIFEREEVERVICAGDIAGYNDELTATIDLLIQHDAECIVGNHDRSFIEENPGMADTRDYRFLEALPAMRRYTLEGTRVYVVHAEPPAALHGGIKLLDLEGRLIPEQVDSWTRALAGLDTDVLVVGHTHQVFSERLGKVLVINPGSAPYNNSCMILELPSMQVAVHALPGRQVTTTWNWGMQVRAQT